MQDVQKDDYLYKIIKNEKREHLSSGFDVFFFCLFSFTGRAVKIISSPFASQVSSDFRKGINLIYSPPLSLVKKESH